MTSLMPALIAMSLVLSAQPKDAPRKNVGLVPPTTSHSKEALVKRGQLLVSIAGCNDCHTPKKVDPKLHLLLPDMSRMLSGHREDAPAPKSTLAEGDLAVIGGEMTSFKLEVGTVFTANLTPDKETGLGNWNEALFIKTLRTGRHLGVGRALLPPMPWFDLGRQSDDDLKAIFSYLQSIPAVRNRVPAPTASAEALDQLGTSYDQLVKQQQPAPGSSR